jgi:aspartate aminotransferase-like enzyme
VYSCSQKGLGAPSSFAPVTFAPRAIERASCRSFYLDLKLLHDYWVARKYHHTISATLVYALREALVAVEEEGLEAQWASTNGTTVLAAALAAWACRSCRPRRASLTLNAVGSRGRGRRGAASALGVQPPVGAGPAHWPAGSGAWD